MKIDVKKVAKLANLSLSNDEEDSPRYAVEAGKYSAQLSKILDYIEQLNQVDTSKVEPTFNVIPNQNVMREDKTGENLTQEEALLNAPQTKDGFIVTKGVFEEEI